MTAQCNKFASRTNGQSNIFGPNPDFPNKSQISRSSIDACPSSQSLRRRQFLCHNLIHGASPTQNLVCRSEPEWPRARMLHQQKWGEQDSNLRRHSQQIYSLSRLTASVPPRFRRKLSKSIAESGSRCGTECVVSHL